MPKDKVTSENANNELMTIQKAGIRASSNDESKSENGALNRTLKEAARNREETNVRGAIRRCGQEKSLSAKGDQHIPIATER